MGARVRVDTAAVLVVVAVATGAACGTTASQRPATATAPSVTATSFPAPSSAPPSSFTAPSSSPSSVPPTGTSAPPTPRTTSQQTSSTSSTGPAGALPAWLTGIDLEVMPTKASVIALTFDGGSDASGAASILATLATSHTPATFFLTGAFTDRYPALARQVAAAHRIGNHTQGHVSLTTLDDAGVRAQITAAQQQILAVTGVDPRPWFRFPNGDRDSRTIADVNRSGYAAVRWTVDTLGWKGTSGGQSVATVRERVLAAARPGAIVLMHLGANPDDGTTLDAEALPGIIAALTARGYTFVDLDAMLGQ